MAPKMYVAIFTVLVSYSLLSQCNASCVYGNIVVQADTTYLPSPETAPCKNCYCPTDSTDIECFTELCAGCPDPVYVPGQCCPICASDLVSDALDGNE